MSDRILTDDDCLRIVKASIDPDRKFDGPDGHEGGPPDVLLTTVERILAEHTQALRDELANACEITRLAEESEKGWRREAEELAVERNRLRDGIEALASDLLDEALGRVPDTTTAQTFGGLADRLRKLLDGEAS